jgi:subfamily B ATP-binding cassette protein MsbA
VNLYKRTFLVLGPYWRQLLTASLSAALHAVLAGLLVWLAGPLLMTLFHVDSIGGVQPGEVVAQAPLTPEAGDATGLRGSLADLSAWITELRETMKAHVHDVVTATSRRDTLLNFCWLIMAVAIFKNLFLYLQGFFMAFVQQSVIRSLRNQLFEKYQRLSLDYFHRRRTGRIMSRVTNDVVVLNESIDLSFNHLVTDSIMALIFFAFLIILSWKLTLLAMIVLPLVFAFIWFVGKKMRKYSERSQERMADVNSVLEEAVNNVRIVKAFSMEGFEFKKFGDATFQFFRSLLRMTRIRHLASPINDTLISFAGVVILLYAGARIIAGTGEMDAGDFMTFLVAMFSMIKPVKSLSQIHIKVQEGIAAAQRIFQVLDTDEKIVNAPGARRIETFRECIKYDHVSFSYNSGVEVLKEISFDVRIGEVVAVVGPSGGGASRRCLISCRDSTIPRRAASVSTAPISAA